jgi:hypothetical protein
MSSSGLRRHLLRQHGRTAREIDGLPLADFHRFEHVEQAMGLIPLAHRHPGEEWPRKPSIARGAPVQ